MYRNQMMDSGMYDRGSANMLGKVLIFVFIAIVLTAFGVIGFSHMIRDRAYANLVAAQNQREAEVHEGSLQAKIAAEEQQAQDAAVAQGILTIANAQADAAKIDEATRMQAERNTQRLAREKLLGEAAIGVGALATMIIVLMLGLMGVRLVNRLLPAQPRAAAPAPAAAQPARPPATPAAPPTVVLRADSDAFRPRANDNKARATQPAAQNSRPAAAPLTQRPLPAH
jgi:cell division protein FtsL